MLPTKSRRQKENEIKQEKSPEKEKKPDQIRDKKRQRGKRSGVHLLKADNADIKSEPVIDNADIKSEPVIAANTISTPASISNTDELIRSPINGSQVMRTYLDNPYTVIKKRMHCFNLTLDSNVFLLYFFLLIFVK